MRIKAFFIIVGIQIVVIFYLFFQIDNNRERFTNVIDSKSIQKSNSGNLKYFYEPKANTTEEVHQDWLQYTPVYTINKDSLNERFDYDVQKKSGVFRIITLGDSFTFGQNSSTDHNWTELLEDKLNQNISCKGINRFEVINLGVYGYDTQYEVERFKIRGQKYNPDLVIWTFDDYERILEKMMPTIEKQNLIAKRGSKEKEPSYGNMDVARNEMMGEIGLMGTIKFQWEMLDKMDKYYRGDLIYVSMPSKQSYSTMMKCKSLVRPNSYFFLPNIQWNQSDLFLPDRHFNGVGNEKMTDEIMGYLIKNKIIRCLNK